MSRYIDADAVITAIAEFNKYEDELEYPYASDDLEEYKDDARLLIEDAPSIDLVFCEECRECVEKGVGVDCPSGYGYLYCTRKKSVVDEDDYCSWGERR